MAGRIGEEAAVVGESGDGGGAAGNEVVILGRVERGGEHKEWKEEEEGEEAMVRVTWIRHGLETER